MRLYNLLCRLPCKIELLVSDRTLSGEVITQGTEKFGNINVTRVVLQSASRLGRLPPWRYIHIIYRIPKILVNAAQGLSFDVIHAHNPFPMGKAARKLSQKSHKPFVLELHAVRDDYLTGAYSRFKETVYLARENNKALVSSDKVITLTQSQREWLCHSSKVPESKVVVVPNGADLNQFAPTEESKRKAEELRESLGISGKVVMYAGYMDRLNGLPGLAEVIPWVIREKSKVCFLFIGHGPEEERIISLSKEYRHNVRYLPTVPYSEMASYYQLCDVFVIPRPSTISAETLAPLKLLEAMAMEKPVLGSNVGGIAEVIRHGENGYLFQKGNMESFKKVLLEATDADNAQIGKNARRTVMENYTWEKSAKVLQEIYEDIV